MILITIITKVLLDIPNIVFKTGKCVIMLKLFKDAEMAIIDLQVGCVARRHLQPGVPGALLLPCSAHHVINAWLDAFSLVQPSQLLSSKNGGLEEVHAGHKGLLSLTLQRGTKILTNDGTASLPEWQCLVQDLLHYMVSAHVASSSQPSTDEAAKEIRRLAAKYAWWWDAHKRDAEPTTIYWSIDAAITSG